MTHIVDFMFADESFYLHMGATFKLAYLSGDGGVYFLWLKFLTMLCPNLVMAYCWNYAILICINPILLYFLFRKMGKTPFTSAFFSIFFLVTILNIITWPFITRFSSAIILLILLMLFSVKNNKTRYMVSLIGLFVLVYTRPEFLMALLIFSIVSILYFIYKFFKDRAFIKPYILPVIITVVLLVFAVFIKNPAVSGRSVFAFGQHYGLNFQNTGEFKTADAWENWREVMKEKFKTDRSLFTAFKNNPGEMMKHIASNVKQFPLEFFYQLFPYHSQRFHPPAKQAIKYFILLLFFVPIFNFIRVFVIYLKNRKKGDSQNFFSDADKFFYLISIILLFPVLFSLFVIYPRSHYMLSFFLIIFPMVIRNMPLFIGKKIPIRYVDFVVKAAIMVLILVWIPWKATGSTRILPHTPKESCSYLQRVLMLRKINVRSDVNILQMFLPQKFCFEYFKMYMEDGSGYSYRVFEPDKKIPIDEYIITNKINMIYVDEKFQNLLKHVQGSTEVQGNWGRVDIPGCGEFVLVNSSLFFNLSEPLNIRELPRGR
jgi:hypothetical protein